MNINLTAKEKNELVIELANLKLKEVDLNDELEHIRNLPPGNRNNKYTRNRLYEIRQSVARIKRNKECINDILTAAKA